MPFEDPARWHRFRPRADDIVIATPMKAGTTWMQEIVASLLWPDGPPAVATFLSPWLDSIGRPIDEVLAQLDAMTHRRFIKTHSSPADVSLLPACRYVVVMRRPADTLVSWASHRAGFTEPFMARLGEPLRDLGGDDGLLFDEWVGWRADPVHHLAAWLPHLDDANVLLVHYDDLLADLDGQMRLVAGFLDIAIGDITWPAQVERCRFESMKATYVEAGAFDRVVERGSERFFRHGVSGDGATDLSPETQARCGALARALLPPDQVAWLER